jgi:hypothetical protein
MEIWIERDVAARELKRAEAGAYKPTLADGEIE